MRYPIAVYIDDSGEEWAVAKLSCGHTLKAETWRSTWDDPAEPNVCGTCGELRQWSLEVQAAMYGLLERYSDDGWM